MVAGSLRSSSTPVRRWARPLRRMVMSARERRSGSERRGCSSRARRGRAPAETGGGAGAGAAVAQPPTATASRRAPRRLLLLGLGRRTLGPGLALPRLLDLGADLGRGRPVRIRLQRLLPRLDRLVGEVVLEVGVAQVLVEDGVLLGEAHRALQLAEGLRVAALLVIGPAEAVDEVAVLGLERQRLLDELDRLAEIRAALGVHVADVVVRLGVLGVDREHATEGA